MGALFQARTPAPATPGDETLAGTTTPTGSTTTSRSDTDAPSGNGKPELTPGEDELAEMRAEEVSTLYRTLVRRFHPDWRALAGEATPEGAASMYRLWEAHQTLTSSLLPIVKPADGSEPVVRRSLTTLRPPLEHECLFCGSTPAANARFRHQESSFLDRVMVPIEGMMCRSCAQAVGRRKQAQTLQSGWWGLRAPIVNLGVVAANAAELRRVRKRPGPSERADNVISLLRAPMSTWAEIENPRGLVD